MKLSKMRKKARSTFNMRKRVQYRWDADGIVHQVPNNGLHTEVAVIRGRAFTKPQAAVQVDG